MLKKSFLIPILALLSASLFFSIGCKKDCLLPAPTVTVSDISATSAVASWNVIADAINYQVTLLDGTDQQVKTETVTATQFQFKGLMPNSSYKVRVAARCKKDDKLSENVGQAPFQTPQETCNLPAPTNLKATPLSMTTAKVNWTPVVGAIGYEVTVFDSVANKKRTFIVSSPPAPPITLDSLVGGKNYQITVAPICANNVISSNRLRIDYEHYIIIDDVVMFGSAADNGCSKGIKPLPETLNTGPNTIPYVFNATGLTQPSLGGNYYIKVTDSNSSSVDFRITYGDFNGEVKICPFSKCSGYVPPTLEDGYILKKQINGQEVRIELYSTYLTIELPNNCRGYVE
jgi:hypothetical protein